MLLILLMILFLFLGVAFLTLLERYFLSLSQNRSGPFKVFFLGLFQALFDGMKLIFNELEFLDLPNFLMFLVLPFMFFILMFLYFLLLNFFFIFLNFSLVMFFIMFFTSLIFYFVFLSAYYSKSKYSFLGSLRSSCQVLSFDVNFFFFIIMFFFCYYKFNLDFLFFFFSLFFIFLYSLVLFLIELNRSPFDFSEGESELVSGFNVEFSSIIFIFIFLSEYGFIFFWSQFLNYLFFFNLFFIFIFFVFIFLRSVLPRYRYDFLLSLAWLLMLPFYCLYFLFFFFIS